MTKVTAQARHKQSREALEEVSLQTSAKSRQRGCRRYALRQTVGFGLKVHYIVAEATTPLSLFDDER